MKVDLKQRYQTMDEVVDDLEALRSNGWRSAAIDRRPSPTDAARAVATTGPTTVDEPTPSDDAEPPRRPTRRRRSGRERLEVKAVVRKNVLCVEVQEEIQEAFRKTLSKMGYRVLLVADAERAAERYRESPPDAVSSTPTASAPRRSTRFLDMHEKAHEDGHDLAALVLLGPRQHDLPRQLPTDDRLIVLPKPVKMKEIQAPSRNSPPCIEPRPAGSSEYAGECRNPWGKRRIMGSRRQPPQVPGPGSRPSRRRPSCAAPGPRPGAWDSSPRPNPDRPGAARPG